MSVGKNKKKYSEINMNEVLFGDSVAVFDHVEDDCHITLFMKSRATQGSCPFRAGVPGGEGVRERLERMKALCKERNELYEKQNDLRGQKQQIERGLAWQNVGHGSGHALYLCGVWNVGVV